MTILALAQVREHVESDISDNALQRIIDGAEQDIISMCGNPLTQTDEIPVYPSQYSTWIFLTRPAASITTVVESVGVSDTTLAADDYRLYHKSQLKRLDDGTNSRAYWGDRVKVTYVPEDDKFRREGVLIKLVQLSVNYFGVGAQRSGDFSCSAADYDRERKLLLSSLIRQGGFV